MPDKRFFEQQEVRRQQAQGAHLKQQQAAFARAASSAEPTDRFGQPLREGDLIVYAPPIDMVFQIVEVQRTSALDPRAPAGLVNLLVTATFPITINAMQPVSNIIRVGRTHSAEQTSEALTEANGEPKPELTIEKVEEPETEHAAPASPLD